MVVTALVGGELVIPKRPPYVQNNVTFLKSICTYRSQKVGAPEDFHL